MRKLKKLALGLVAVVVTVVAAAHWYTSDRGRFTTPAEYAGLERMAEGNALVSEHDPAAVLQVDPAIRYLGGQKFVLYGVADTEQHFFVETTEDDRLASVYWVQYEAYLPGKPYTYDYSDSPLRVTLGDYEFFTDTEAFHFDPDRERKRGTDGARAREFLARSGYRYPDEVLYSRLVYLTDASKQKELMIIFMDDLDRYGVTAADLQADGSDAERWPEIEQAHLDRIRRTLRVLPLAAWKEEGAAAGSGAERAFDAERRLFTSSAHPALELPVPEEFRYLGAISMELGDRATAERQLFARVNDSRVEALLVLQFEGLQPGVEGAYSFAVPPAEQQAGSNYRFSPEPVRLGAHEWVHNTWAFDNDVGAREKPGWEADRTARFLAEKGLELSPEMIMSRFVRAVGEDSRRELILFYMEPLDPHGHTLADFPDGEPPSAVYDRLSAGVEKRSLEIFGGLVEPPPSI